MLTMTKQPLSQKCLIKSLERSITFQNITVSLIFNHPCLLLSPAPNSESVFGYQNLQIQLYYTAGKLNTYLGMKFKKQVDPKQFDGAIVSLYI